MASEYIMDVSEEDFLREKAEIDECYRAIKIGQVFRKTALA